VPYPALQQYHDIVTAPQGRQQRTISPPASADAEAALRSLGAQPAKAWRQVFTAHRPALTSISSPGIHLIAFSKNRPWQLQQCVASAFSHLRAQRGDLSLRISAVICEDSESAPGYAQARDDLSARARLCENTALEWIVEQPQSNSDAAGQQQPDLTFGSILTRLILDGSEPHVMFAVDDMLFVADAPVQAAAKALSKNDDLCCLLGKVVRTPRNFQRPSRKSLSTACT